MGTMHDCDVKGCTEVTPPGTDRLPDEWGLVTYPQERVRGSGVRGSGVVYLCPVHLKRVSGFVKLLLDPDEGTGESQAT